MCEEKNDKPETKICKVIKVNLKSKEGHEVVAEIPLEICVGEIKVTDASKPKQSVGVRLKTGTPTLGQIEKSKA